MLDAMVGGLDQVLSAKALGLMLLGVIIGTINGITPGMGVNIGLALAIPFVFGMDPFMGFVLLLSLHGVGMTGGSITSIMLSVPGTGPNTATIVDGYPMAQRGEGGRAIGAALTASGTGGIIGAMVLALLIPVLRPIVLALGSGEVFMLIVFGLTFIAAVSGRSLLRGLIAACFGLALSMVGLCPYSGFGRFTFGQMWLWDGIHIVTLVVGLFAVSEMINLGARGSTIALADAIDIKEACRFRQVFQGVKDTFHHWWLLIRSSVIGAVVGIIPGLGGDVAVWIVYGHAAQTCKNNENFGKGDVRGVIAPEGSNNAKEGGALLPTVAFGIPGSSGMAILLGAFLILGISPGPEMIVKHLDIVWGMVWILVFANILASLMLLASAKYVAKVAFVRPTILIPLVIILAMLGSVLASGHWQNLFLTTLFGVLGYWMKKANYPLAAVVLGFVLGGLAEKNLHQALGAWGPAFVSRPWTLVLLAMAILSGFYSLFQRRWGNTTERMRGEGEWQGRTMTDLVIGSIMVVTFACMLGMSLSWSGQRRFFPLIIAMFGLTFCLAHLLKHMVSPARPERPTAEAHEKAITAFEKTVTQKATPKSEVKMVLWILMGLGIILVFGFWVAVFAFTIIFMRLYGRESWKLTAAIAGCAWLMCFLVFHIALKFSLYGGVLALSFF